MPFRYSTVFVALADSGDEILTQFYTRLFSREPDLRIPNVYAEFQLSGLRLGIFHPKQGHQSEFAGQTSGRMSLCLEVEDLAEAIRSVEQAYANIFPVALDRPLFGEIVTASHGRETYVYDPVGNRLILHQLM